MVLGEPARSLAAGRDWRDVQDRYARWVTVVRAQRPGLLVTYPVLFGATPLIVLAALILACVGGRCDALAAAGLALGVRALLALRGYAFRARWMESRPPTWSSFALDIARSDVLLLAAFGQAMTSRSVEWRGRRLGVSRSLTDLGDTSR